MEPIWAELRTFRFVLQGKQKEAEQARIRFAGDTRSDHLALLNAFQVILVRVLAICVNFFFIFGQYSLEHMTLIMFS